MSRTGRAKAFLEGLVGVVDALDRGAQAIDKLRGTRGAPRTQIIDTHGVEIDPNPVRSRSGMIVTHHDVRTIDERCAYIVRMIQAGRDHPTIRKISVQAVSRRCDERWCVEEGDYDGEVVAIWNALREKYRYVRDTYGKDLFQHPDRTLEFGGGDCDDAVILLGSCLGSIGYPTRLRVIRTKGNDDWNHIYLLVGLPPRAPTRWVPLDMSEPVAHPGWEAPADIILAIRDFDVPARDIAPRGRRGA